MKKNCVALLFFILVNLCCIFASSSPWAVKSVNLALGNDKRTYGLSRNDDDQLSFSEHVAIEAQSWYLRANLKGITNRGWKTGWDIRDESISDTSEDDFYSGRLDVTEIRFGLNYNHTINDLVFPFLGVITRNL